MKRETVDNLKLSALINLYSAVNIPLLSAITPRVMELSDGRSMVRVRLDRRTRNHLNVMYFGALAMGAELSVALKAITAIQKSGKKIDFIFKDFQAEFLKRAFTELAELRLRGRLANGGIALLTLCAFLIGLTIIVLFVGETTGFKVSRWAVGGFLSGVVPVASLVWSPVRRHTG